MRERIFIGIGSNIEPEMNIKKAMRFLARNAGIIGLSTLYRSEPEGDLEAPPFINGAAEISTDAEPEWIKWELLRPVEDALGRVRTPDRNAPRPLDLDLLLYGNRIMANPRLTLPDPGIVRYPFVAVPLLELAPDLLLPNASRSLKNIVDAMDRSGMVPLPEFTSELKKMFNI